MKQAKFNIGDIVIHRRQGYRAIIVDIDPIFRASGRHNPRALQGQFADRLPWYRLLVDDSNQMTYVEEIHLELAPLQEEINNPQIEEYLKPCKQGGYAPQRKPH